MDGVILDSEPLHIGAFQATLKQYGHNLTDLDYKNHFAGKTDEAGFESYFNFVNENIDFPVIMDEKARMYLAMASDQLVAYPGVVALIKRLSRKIPLALVTGSLREEANVAMRAFNIDNCFASTITAEDIMHSKPSPEGYLKAARSLGVMPADCVIIEDAPSGVKAAKNAKITCIAVTNTHSAMELAEANIVVEDLTYGLFE